MHRGVVQATTGTKEAPPVALLVDEGHHPVDQCLYTGDRGGGGRETVRHPVVQSTDQPGLNGIDQSPSVPEVGVDQGPGDAGGTSDLLERGDQRILLGQDSLRRVQHELAPESGGEPFCPQEPGPEPICTRVSPGSSGW